MSIAVRRAAVAVRCGSAGALRPARIAAQPAAAALLTGASAPRTLFTGARQRGMLRPSFQRQALARGMASLPSHVALQMPALSPTMTSGNISKWMIKVGQKMAPGDHIADLETDKATIAWEAQEEGFIAKILAEEGTADVPVGKTVLIICDDEADVPAFADYKAEDDAPKPAAKAAKPAAPAAPAKPAAAPPPPPPPSSSAPVTRSGSILATVKGKKWVFSKEFGLPTAQHQY